MALSVWSNVAEMKAWDNKASLFDEYDFVTWWMLEEVKDFAYTWAEQSYSVKQTWKYKLQVWGAEWWYARWNSGLKWWRWGYSEWIVKLAVWETLYAYVWWRGANGTTSLTGTAFNGWWRWGYSNYSSSNWQNWWWGWGTDFRIWWNTLYHRLIVAWWGWGGTPNKAQSNWHWWWVEWGTDYSGKQWTQTWGNAFWEWGSSTSNWEWNRYSVPGWWGGWYWAKAQTWGSSSDSWSDANWYTGWWSWFIWEWQSSVPSWYLVQSKYILELAKTVAWSQSHESVDWWTETWHLGSWYARISAMWLKNVVPTYVTQAWAYHNAELWLISISTDWENWFTISDKNVWASSSDVAADTSYWNVFQYWNTHWFPWDWDSTAFETSADIPDLTGYEWWNLFSNALYRINSWWNAANSNLWKWVAFTNLLSLYKGPCPKGFHVPTEEEFQNMLDAILELAWEWAEMNIQMLKDYILLPNPNSRNWSWVLKTSSTYLTNSYYDTTHITGFVMSSDWDEETLEMDSVNMNEAWYVRPFRDVVMVPTTEWTRLTPQHHTVRLPLEYQEVEYIESSGTGCWINTGITPHDTNFFEIEFKMNPTTLKSSWNYFYWTNSSGAWNSFEYTSNNGSYWNVWSSTLIWTLSPNLSTWTDYIFDCKYSWNNWWTLTVSWTYTKSVNYSWSTWTRPLCFFCQWDDLGSQSAEKLYYLKIYTWDSEANKSLVRDFVPCYRRIDWAIWMYDIVNNVFYANIWSWTFWKWADVDIPELPDSYTEVEYLQSNWWQYIDTRIDKNEILTPFIRYEFYSDTSSTDCWFLWYWSSWWYIFWESQNQYRFTAWWTQWWSSSWISYSTWRHVFTTNASNWYLDWVQWAWNWWNMTIYNWTLHLFRAWGWFNVPSWNVRVYSCLVWSSNDNLIHYYIPCFRNSDSKAGLYDLITREFLVNGWTGEFTIWPRTKHAYQVNENTKLYMPLTSEVRDLSWKATITNTWVTITNLNWVYCWSFNWSSRIETNISAFTNINHTLACWVKRNWWDSAWLICANPCWVFNWDVLYPNSNWDKYVYQSYHTTSSSGFSIESNTLNQREWHWVIFTWWKLYVDWVLQWSNNWWYVWWQVYTIWWHTTNSSCTRKFLTWYIAEVIIEDWVWTESQVVDYYNSTKNIFE